MSQSYLIFSEGRKIQVEKAKRFTASFDSQELENGKGKLKDRIVTLVGRWENGEFQELKFKAPVPKNIFNSIKSAYAYVIIAAGGLVINRKGKLLVIFRKGMWDLPKGKIEEGESVRKGAIREVTEETGLQGVRIKKEFTRTYHTYILDGKRVLKETVWFLMTCDDDKTTPQLSEGITSIAWISKSRLKEISTNTFDNILLLLRAYFRNRA